jgi:hypothetical protein
MSASNVSERSIESNPVVTGAAKQPARSNSRGRSNSQEPLKATESTDTIGTSATAGSAATTGTAASTSSRRQRSLSRRSPFTKFLAERKAVVRGNSNYDLKKKASSASKAKASPATEEQKTKPSDASEPKKMTAPPSDESASVTPSDEMASSKSNEEPPATEKSESMPGSVDQSADLPANVSALSEENVEKHADDGDYEDPPLEELESEATAATDADAVQKYLAENSILGKLATSPVHEVASPVTSPVTSPKQEPVVSGKKVNTDRFCEEKKEDAWDLSNPELSNFTSSQDSNFKPVFDKDNWEPEVNTKFSDSAFSNTEEDKADSSPPEVDVDAERNFIKMMTEEMKFRPLSEKERKMMFEAQGKIRQAEENKKIERDAVAKDDEPLIAQTSAVNSVEANTGVTLGERLKAYENREPDAESDEASTIQGSSADEDEIKVDYVDQKNEDEEPVDGGDVNKTEEPIDLVSSNDVPTLEVAASAASASKELPPIPRTLSELKKASPPPPPPPGGPKKKKKKKKKSKSKKIPLIPPPSEEKLDKWNGDPQDFVLAMAENLANAATKALDASSEYFAKNEENKEEKEKEANGSATSEELPQDDKKESPEVSPSEDAKQTPNEEKNTIWKKEVNDAIGLVERLEEEYDDEKFPQLALLPTPLLSEEESEGEDTENKTSDGALTLSVDVLSSPTRVPNEASMFASPKSTKTPKANELSEDVLSPSNARDVLTTSEMAEKVALATSAAANAFEERFVLPDPNKPSKEFESLAWFSNEVLKKEFTAEASEVDVSTAARLLVEDKDNFNCMCRFVADSVNEVSVELRPSLKTTGMTSFDADQLMSRTLSAAQSGDPGVSKTTSISQSGDQVLAVTNTGTMSTASSGDSDDKPVEVRRILLKPVILSDASITLSSKYIAANFVSFLFMASKLTKVPSPFGDNNPFLSMIVESSMETIGFQESSQSVQELIFEQLDGKVEGLLQFIHELKTSCDAEMKALSEKADENAPEAEETIESNEEPEIPAVVGDVADSGKRFIVPEAHPSPFESSTEEAPRIVAAVLSFLGDPVAVCQLKKVNTNCNRIVSENEHVLMQDAVRSGGIDPSHRPAFWMHVALEKIGGSTRESKFKTTEELDELVNSAENEKWHHIIQRDVDRSFGNMPPHKTGATFDKDSIIEALVTWGQSRYMKRGVKGGGEPVPTPDIGDEKQKSERKATNISSPPWKSGEANEKESENADAPIDTVTDWGAVTPKGSFADPVIAPSDESIEEIALCGNSLSAEEKADLQKKLGYILHALAATYEDIGYCQGMDYVVAHLLRNLQETIRWKAANKQFPSVLSTASGLTVYEDAESMRKEIDSKHVVEETVVQMMNTFFVDYNLKHMYWPELRCLKTCCRVFERLIQIKLPVLADHFEHHDLNIGLFALGWFQTLFLYLPSMPSETVCRMWDIWLVERSFKIFFRVGTAILFLSQPTLLNYELEGMMTYLNTIPDATLLRPDILIPCALNIKVTNRLLQELEDEVMQNPN